MEFKITEKKPTICLNMIVKNESHIIENTLQKLCKKISFDYWVICDTGSTDNTTQIINDFFLKKEIKGELFNDEWVNFAHNRTLALERAYKKTDLLLIFDADDEIVGDINLPSKVLFDEYHLKFGSSSGLSYTRVLLINNHKKFQYLSVIHEFINCKEGPVKTTTIDGDYYVISGRNGNRSLDPDKYLKDALILEKAYEEALINDNQLFNRYAFYCANSYKDCSQYENAIKWYKITLSHEKQWDQEKYVSCLYIFDCLNALNRKEEGFFYLVKSISYDCERVECLYYLLQHYCCENMNQVAYNYYLNVKDFYENRYLTTNIFNKLFIISDKFNFFVPYYMILIADKVKDFRCVIKMYEIVFIKKQKMFEDWYIKNFLYNLQFFLKYVNHNNKTNFVSLANDYIHFLVDNGVNLHNYDFLHKEEYKNFGINFDKYILKEITFKSQKFSHTECFYSKNILIYTGFSDVDWNYTYTLTNAIGGSEKAVAYLSKCFPKDYTIYISGHVKNETIDNIHYIHLDQLTNLINQIPFNTVIVSRYISFYEMFQTCSFYQSFIWAHDVLLLSYGTHLSDSCILKKWNKYINGVFCLTEWHKNHFLNIYPEIKDKIQIINNGINIDSFKADTNNKIKNRFIYTSRPDRGLDNLLKLWPKILERIPDATLAISSYGNFPSKPEETILKKIIDENPDTIRYLGKLNTDKLYEEMAYSEYWLYPTHWPETSCITALEMLMSEVICLYYPVAGLTNTIDKYGIQVCSGEEIETIVSLTEEQKENLRKNGKLYALNYSWENRFNKWEKICFKNKNFLYENNFIKVINLERRKDRLISITNKLKFQNIENYEIIKAVDGKNLEPSLFIKELFEGNNFNYRKGVIGCALSHYNLWNKLVHDKDNNYYCIFEDDIIFVDNFKEKLEKILNIFDGDFCLLGGGSILHPNNDIFNLKILKRTDKILDGTFGYFISKNGARKMINYIKSNRIKRAIDSLYTECFENINVVNEYLVSSLSFQLNGNQDTDIQLDYDNLLFNNPIKISYTDWWESEYCGGSFEPYNNFFTKLLSKYYNIQVINPEDNPDILFFSVFGENHKYLTAKRKIFYSGEPISQKQYADFNITFDKNSDNNCRLPLWVLYLNDELINYNNKKEFDIPRKTKFCSIICQQDNKTGERGKIIEKLSKYKCVDCGGIFMNNIGYVVPRGLNCSGKIEFNNSYKFSITFENTDYPGYVTEKIYDSYKSRCIPIYWGTNYVIKDFNPKTFINANDFKNFDKLIEYIIKVDTDDALYESYFKEPIFSEYWLDIFNDQNNIFYKNLASNIVENKLDIQNYEYIDSVITPTGKKNETNSL
jgi:GR25 family glycosyltransferase involved in LPS biosynthesis/glycosyltransferase involved in cell wall biosynthesis